MRVGMGYDVLKLLKAMLGELKYLMIRVLGHSDADVLVHALWIYRTGSGTGDRHFPDTDPEYKGHQHENFDTWEGISRR